MIEELLSSVMWVVHCVMMCDYGGIRRQANIFYSQCIKHLAKTNSMQPEQQCTFILSPNAAFSI